MTFEQFSASGRDVEDLGVEHPGLDLEGIPGRVYEGGGYVERHGDGWYLCIGRDEYVAPLAQLERLLFDWCTAEEFFA